MTASSGPGISLMLENISLAIMTEAPCVIVNVMRCGPSEGQPTSGSQGDVMQCRWGSYGDFEIIALAPQSVQEMFDLTIHAFNLSERYRVPVFLMADANIGHMYESLKIPQKEKITIVNRKKPTVAKSEYKPYSTEEGLVPPMANFGEGYRFYSTGLTHDERGYPDMSIETQDKLVRRLCDKIRKDAANIEMFEEHFTDDCDVLVVSYGTTARSALSAVKHARDLGIKAGLLRLVTIWPFPDARIEKLSKQCNGVIVPEMNYGQLYREVERAAMRRVKFLPKLGENPHTPDEIVDAIRRVKK
jgi:2-oxoglutarate ferredoxin oxidoreductase subunit alpha